MHMHTQDRTEKMQALTALLARAGVSVQQVPVQTVYIDIDLHATAEQQHQARQEAGGMYVCVSVQNVALVTPILVQDLSPNASARNWTRISTPNPSSETNYPDRKPTCARAFSLYAHPHALAPCAVTGDAVREAALEMGADPDVALKKLAAVFAALPAASSDEVSTLALNLLSRIFNSMSL
jgi:hypothetical protein